MKRARPLAACCGTAIAFLVAAGKALALTIEPDGLELKLARELAIASAPVSPLLILAAIVAFLVACIVALVANSFVSREIRERRAARIACFRKVWEPILYARIAEDPVPLPALASSERLLFAELWLHTMGYVRDEAADELTAIARQLDMPRYTMKLLEGRSGVGRLLGTRMAAALRLPESVPVLVRKVTQRRQRSSLEAARALLQIDPERGFEALHELLSHLEWSPGAMVDTVRAGGPGAIGVLCRLLESFPPGKAKQVVRLLELLDDPGSVPALRKRLEGNGDSEEIAVILHALGKLGGASERDAVLAFVDHPDWLVRMQAATALGAIAMPGDDDRLEPLLCDSAWWVRYRAAKALAQLRSPEQLRRLRAAQTDRFAGDILDRVLAEGGTA